MSEEVFAHPARSLWPGCALWLRRGLATVAKLCRLRCATRAGRSAMGGFEPFPTLSANDCYLRIPAEDGVGRKAHPPPLREIGGGESVVIPASVRIRLSRDLQNGRAHGVED